jgi:hypothetical protein
MQVLWLGGQERRVTLLRGHNSAWGREWWLNPYLLIYLFFIVNEDFVRTECAL